MSDVLLLADERAILAHLSVAAENDPAGFVSLKGMLGEDKADLPREHFDRADWERMTDLYFAVRNLLMMGLVSGIAADGGKHLNRFRINGAGREALRGQSGPPDAAP